MSEWMQLALRPIQQIMKMSAEGAEVIRWRTTGDDPAFECEAPAGALAGGWYVLEFDLQVHRGRICNPCLYMDYGQAWQEDGKVNLDVNARAGDSVPFRNGVVLFVRDLNRLRFDPSVVPVDFSLSTLRLRRIGKLEAARRLLSGVFWRPASPVAKVRTLIRTLTNLVFFGPRRMADRLYLTYLHRVSQEVKAESADYESWLQFYDVMDELRLENAALVLDRLSDRPVVSVLLPVYNTPERWLRSCIESVQNQVYPDWQLCIADDASTQPHVEKVVEEYAARDSRIRFLRRESNGHIAAATNSALTLAEGKYVALLDHDDELHPMALLECVKAFEENPAWEMLFTDEDKIDEQGRRSDPYFKSDWNPDLFFSQNCICHLTVYSRALLESIGGFRIGFEGAQDWDLTLRAVERLKGDQIGHVPKVLYHWRAIAGSTALSPGEKSYAHLAAIRALQDYFDRNALDATANEIQGYSGYYRITYRLPEPPPLVSLLIPTRDRVGLLRQCVGSILEKTTYGAYEIIILDNDSSEPETLRYFENVVADPRVRVVKWPHPFNYSAINNFGVQHARGSLIGLLNNDVEVITPGWLTEMAGHAQRPEIGMVGAMLYYPDDTIQHAGVVLGIGGVAGHAYVRREKGYPGDKHRAGLAQTLSAVTAACAVVRKEVFEEVGGFDEALRVAFNDIDLCLRIRSRGYRNLWTPFAELYHHESATRGYEDTPEKIKRFKQEEKFMKERWGAALESDPYYNVNFTLNATPFSLAYPPRHR